MWFLWILASLGCAFILAFLVVAWINALRQNRAPVVQQPRPPRREPPRSIPFNGPRGRKRLSVPYDEPGAGGPFRGIWRGAKRALEGIGRGLDDIGQQLLSAPPPRQSVVTKRGSFESSVRPRRKKSYVIVDHSGSQYDAYRDLYVMTHAMYNRDLARDTGDWRWVFPEDNWQAIYAECKEHWTIRGWVKCDGRGAIQGWTAPEWKLYASDPLLRRIATEEGFKWPDGSHNGRAQ